MLDIDLLMAVPGGLALRRPDRLLEFFGEPIDVHISILDLWGRLSNLQADC